MVRLTNAVSHRKNKNQHNETRFCPPNRGRLIADGVSLRVDFRALGTLTGEVCVRKIKETRRPAKTA